MHLSKLAIPKPDLAQFASARNFSQQLTTRYVVHSVLAEAFSECPTPFEVQDKGRLLRVLFYSEKDADGLASHAKFAASPEAYEAVNWTEAASKPMPESFPAGMELRFSLRACPVVRKASAGKGRNKDGEIRKWDEGTELDAFLSRQWTSDTELSRKEVYCDWLEHQFDARGGAVPKDVTMERFTIAEMTRRTGGNNRSVKSMKRPDVTLQGTLKVEDSAPFARLLRSGLGRHKSFGYGMLKIRPV
jgi:CRISPR system Cascade subunit CasE